MCQTQDKPRSIKVEKIFLLSSLVLFSAVLLSIEFFKASTESLGTFSQNREFFVAGGLLGVINLKSWSILFSFLKTELMPKQKRTASILLFIVLKLAFIIVFLALFVLGMKEELVSLLFGFIGYLFSGSMGTAFYFLATSRAK